MASVKKKDAHRPGHQFEEQVATLLRLFGYEVERNIKFRGNQIDVRATVELPTHRDIILVECKDHGRSIGIETVRSFFSVIAEAPNDIRGLFVAREDFSAEAREFADQTPRLTVATYRDLERRVIDPGLYLQKKIRAYPRTAVASVYVDLGCKDLKQQDKESAEQEINADINNPEIEFIAILGEYGSGKTTLLDHLEYSLAASYLSAGTSRIPLRINLGEYTKALNLRQLITDLLVHQFGVRGPRYDVFESLNEQGRLVLLFDGFDEMSSRVDDVVVRENFAAIQRLCVPGSKVVLTCRTSFFRSRQEEASLFGIETDRLRQVIVEGRAKSTSVYWLNPLTWTQTEKIVHNAARNKRGQKQKRLDAGALLERIRSTYNLQELAQRPFLLDMIIQSIQHADLSTQTLTAGLLYEIYTEEWVRRDARKGRTLETPEKRLFFAEELALTLWTRSPALLHWSLIPSWINERLGVPDAAKDYYDYDVRSSNFLSRNEQGSYFLLIDRLWSIL